VILDLEMPVLNGFDTAAAIRHALSRAPPLLIAVSGSPAYVATADAGSVFDHAFQKPLDFEALFRLVFEEGSLGSHWQGGRPNTSQTTGDGAA
jgi:CheY-like chemotaxis protein